MTESIIKVNAPVKLPIYQNMIDIVQRSFNIVNDNSPKYDSAFAWKFKNMKIYSK